MIRGRSKCLIHIQKLEKNERVGEWVGDCNKSDCYFDEGKTNRWKLKSSVTHQLIFSIHFQVFMNEWHDWTDRFVTLHCPFTFFHYRNISSGIQKYVNFSDKKHENKKWNSCILGKWFFLYFSSTLIACLVRCQLKNLVRWTFPFYHQLYCPLCMINLNLNCLSKNIYFTAALRSVFIVKCQNR